MIAEQTPVGTVVWWVRNCKGIYRCTLDSVVFGHHKARVWVGKSTQHLVPSRKLYTSREEAVAFVRPHLELELERTKARVKRLIKQLDKLDQRMGTWEYSMSRNKWELPEYGTGSVLGTVTESKGAFRWKALKAKGVADTDHAAKVAVVAALLDQGWKL